MGINKGPKRDHKGTKRGPKKRPKRGQRGVKKAILKYVSTEKDQEKC